MGQSMRCMRLRHDRPNECPLRGIHFGSDSARFWPKPAVYEQGRAANAPEATFHEVSSDRLQVAGSGPSARVRVYSGDAKTI
jgi:hypothetical protein